MSVLAVLVAITTVLGHRTHTEAVLIRRAPATSGIFTRRRRNGNTTPNSLPICFGALPIRDSGAANKVTDSYKSHLQKWNEDLAEEEKQAKELEAEVRKAERHANRFDLGEALLEIGLVITSITLLTRQRVYWGTRHGLWSRRSVHGGMGILHPIGDRCMHNLGVK